MPKVRFLNEVVEVEAKKGETILECAERAGIPLFRGFWTFGHRYLGCPNTGICGACKVWATGDLPERSKKEQKKLGPGSTARLACRTEIRGDIEVRTQPNGPMPAPDARWPEDPTPSRWKARLAEKEAELAAGAAGAAGGDGEAEA